MKKILLLLSIFSFAISATSCSDDGSNATENNETPALIKFKIDGVQKNFVDVIINEEVITSNGEAQTWLTVTGTEAGDSEEYILFEVLEGEVGADVMYDPSWKYYNNGEMYYGWIMTEGSSMSNVVQVNDAEKLKGTFSGSFRKYDNENNLVSVQVTEGSFDINR